MIRKLRFEALENRRLLVVGGVEPPILTQPDGFEGVAELSLQKHGASSPELCTGTLLTTGRHILTAAHCVVDAGSSSAFPQFPENIDESLSTVNFTTPTGQLLTYSIESVTPYTLAHGIPASTAYMGFTQNQLGGDIAVIELTEAVELSCFS